MNVITHPFLALAHKLDFEQFAPLGFTWIQRLIVDCAGASEWTLRFFPLIAGCLSVILVWDMSRRFLNPYGALITALLIGFAPFAVRYSNEAKQYGVDLFVTAMLLWLRSRSGDTPRKPIVQAGVIGAGLAALLLSTPAVFVLAGMWASYAVMAWRTENRRQALNFVGLAGFIWSAAFGVMYRALLAPSADAYLRRYWLPLDLSVHLRVVSLPSLIMHGFLDPCLSIDSRISLPVFVAGCISLILGGCALAKLRGAHLALLFMTPLVLCLAAALVGKWYLSPRLMLFTAPLCVVLIAATICWLVEFIRGRYSLDLRLIAAVAIAVFPLKAVGYYLRHPEIQDLRGAVEFCQRTMHPGDAMYIFARAMPGWMFYTTDWAKLDGARYDWLKQATEDTGPNAGNIPSRVHRVLSEGLELQHPYRQGVELIGIGEGIFRNIVSSRDANPDPGWSDNEVHRILATQKRRVVILASVVNNRTESALLNCLTRNGGTVISEFHSAASRAEVVEIRGSEGDCVPCSY